MQKVYISLLLFSLIFSELTLLHVKSLVPSCLGKESLVLTLVRRFYAILVSFLENSCNNMLQQLLLLPLREWHYQWDTHINQKLTSILNDLSQISVNFLFSSEYSPQLCRKQRIKPFIVHLFKFLSPLLFKMNGKWDLDLIAFSKANLKTK